jgi:hypothetical protein
MKENAKSSLLSMRFSVREMLDRICEKRRAGYTEVWLHGTLVRRALGV